MGTCVEDVEAGVRVLTSREPQAPRQASERREARDARRKTQRHSTPHSTPQRQQTADRRQSGYGEKQGVNRLAAND
eukprot:scaffold6174_cov125-Isochrysis_galbana.AAC.29